MPAKLWLLLLPMIGGLISAGPGKALAFTSEANSTAVMINDCRMSRRHRLDHAERARIAGGGALLSAGGRLGRRGHQDRSQLRRGIQALEPGRLRQCRLGRIEKYVAVPVGMRLVQEAVGSSPRENAPKTT